MDATDILIAIRRIIVAGGTPSDILRFIDDLQKADDDLDEPLGQACKIDDTECESCQ